MNLDGLRIALVGPLPPPAGGMANQTRQLAELLQREGATVLVIQVNAPYRPAWIANVFGVRAACRLLPYLSALWRAASRVQIFHVMANSGWSWHLFAAPAIWIGRLRGISVVVNYRGGEAEAFLARSSALVRRTMRCASVMVVPSGFLREIFDRYGMESTVVPNIVDLERFRPERTAPPARCPLVVVARNLEPIYDIPTALRAFALVRRTVADARMMVAGSGPELSKLSAIARELKIDDAVEFCGRLDRDQMAALYRSADVALNPSRVDNMPNSVLEAMASGVPVVSTNVGGVPFVLRQGSTGLLVDAGDDAAMGDAVLRILLDSELATKLRTEALIDVQQYSWATVRQRWLELYASTVARSQVEVRPA